MTDDIGTGPGNAAANSTLGAPAANGTIFERLTNAGITWADYTASYPAGATMELYPSNDTAYRTNALPISQFFSDAQAGPLPQFSLLDPDYGTQSQENPQNMPPARASWARSSTRCAIRPCGQRRFSSSPMTEHGGYYDHVPPPAAVAPDSIAPVVNPDESTYDGYARYGFRVAAMLIGPYVKRD